MPEFATAWDASWFLSSVKTCFCRSTWPPAVTQFLCFEGHPSDPPLLVMSFRQQLAKNSVNAHQPWLVDAKNKFREECEKVSKSGRFAFSKYFDVPKDASDEKEREFIRQQLEEFLAELGFPEGKVELRLFKNCYDDFFMKVDWKPQDAACTASTPQTSGGTSTTCPICQEHGADKCLEHVSKIFSKI